MSCDSQNILFDVGEDWHQYWQGMPEFIQEDLAPYHSIQANFRTKDDVERLAGLIRQRINPKTRSIWFPELRVDEPR